MHGCYLSAYRIKLLIRTAGKEKLVTTVTYNQKLSDRWLATLLPEATTNAQIVRLMRAALATISSDYTL